MKDLARNKKLIEINRNFQREFNSANIWWTVTLKQYALLHIMV